MVHIFPRPYHCEKKEGNFVFADKVYLILDANFKNKEFIDWCPKFWNGFCVGKSELEIVFKQGIKGNAAIVLSPDVALSDNKTDFEYELVCNEKGFFITYTKEQGLIHAFLSALQLIGPYQRATGKFSACAAFVQDKPALAMRGVHLCLFRQTSLMHLKKMVLVCAILKCSHVCIESWGSIKWETFAPLAWKDSYEKEEFKEIISFGRALGLEFMPFFNHLGHSPQSRGITGKHVVLDQAPEYEEWFKQGGWAWNVDHPEVIEMHKALRKEISEFFGEGEYFHIGGDEIGDYVGLWEDSDVNDSDGYARFLNRTAESVKQDIGRKPVMWGEMFLDRKDYPWPYCANTNEEFSFSPEKLTKDMYVVDWQYNINEDKDETILCLLEYIDPSKLIVSPWTGQERIKGRANLAKKNNLFGMIATTWGKDEDGIGDIIYSGRCMWEQDDTPYVELYSENAYVKSMMSKMVRKLCPSDGTYENSGYKEKEF